jgi:hypothetical protein
MRCWRAVYGMNIPKEYNVGIESATVRAQVAALIRISEDIF